MATTTSPSSRLASANRRTSREFKRESSPESRGLSTRPITNRRFTSNEESLPADTPLSLLLQMSLHSLRGYLEIKDHGHPEVLTTFAAVMVWQRYAQCRELASLVRDFDYSEVNGNQDTIALRLAWIRAVAELDQGNLQRFAGHVAAAEQRLEDACLETAMHIGSESVRERLHAYAVNIYGAQERLDDLLNDSVRL